MYQASQAASLGLIKAASGGAPDRRLVLGNKVPIMVRVPSHAFASCPPQVKRQASPKPSGEVPLFLYDFGRIHPTP